MSAEEETPKIGDGHAFDPVPAPALGVDSIETEHGNKEEPEPNVATSSAAAAAVVVGAMITAGRGDCGGGGHFNDVAVAGCFWSPNFLLGGRSC